MKDDYRDMLWQIYPKYTQVNTMKDEYMNRDRQMMQLNT